MSTPKIDVLKQCREQLLQCIVTPLNFESYREDLCRDLGVSEDLLEELKEAEKREKELDQRCAAAKGFPNKMEYASIVKELTRVKSKQKDLSSEINHSIRNNEVFGGNKKRVKIEMERLDDIVRIAQLELESAGSPEIGSETEDYMPLQFVRQQARTKMKSTLQSLHEVKETLQREKEEHRDLIYDLKTEIKKTRADVEAMEKGTFAPAVEFQARLSERRAAQASELDGRRKAIEGETQMLQSDMEKTALIHEANLNTLRDEERELEQKLNDMAKDNDAVMQTTVSTLEGLKHEHSENFAVLQKLEKRLSDEQEEDRQREQTEEIRRQQAEEERAREEQEYFAALWIQLRWKAYKKRKGAKQSKKGKGKKGSKKKKK